MESIENKQCVQKIFRKNVDHIEWALREILLRPSPIAENAHDRNWPGSKKKENQMSKKEFTELREKLEMQREEVQQFPLASRTRDANPAF